MNADGCRIPRGDAGEVVATRGRSTGRSTYDLGGDCTPIAIDPRGGFPANVIMDEEAAATLKDATPHIVHADGSVGADKFFYTSKASTSERDKGLEDLPTLTPGERSGGREEGSAGINGYAGTRGENGRNPHPTVKPISLMRYLVRRASPPGAWDPDMVKRPVVLDCFMGSGSTGVAAMVEGVRFVGCELGEESAEVARLRLQHAYALPRKDGEAPVVTRVGGQGKLF
jgi:hypothetical protein